MPEINSLPQPLTLIDQRLFLRVHFFRIIFLISGMVAISFVSFAQDDAPVKRRGSRIIDDTTKQVYGPNTSRYYFEKDVFLNRTIYHPIDTAIHNYHRFNFVQRFNNLYQDLGNVGTSIRPIYYQTPENIGVTSGFNSFNLYWDTENVRYYDTKSPYSNVKAVLGGYGRSLTNIAFSRNINPRWNFGFNYRALLIDKQIQRTGKGDRNVKSTYYDIYTAYQSKDSTYRLFFNFRRHYYQANENGGVVDATQQDPSDLRPFFSIEAQRPELTKALSEELRTNFHLFHQYQIFGKGFQVYHVLDAYQQNNSFFDLTAQETSTRYFDNVNIESDTARDAVQFKTFRNEIGLKGNLAKLFYNGYYAIRHYDMRYSYNDNGIKYVNPSNVNVPTNGNEHYLGGRMSLLLDSIGEVHAWAELESNGYYRLEGDIKSKWFEASLKEMRYAPSFLQQYYNGSHDGWGGKAFGPVNVTQINGYLHYNSRILKVSPGLTFTRLNNYTYFGQVDVKPNTNPQTVLPAQSKGSQVIASPELWLSLTLLRHITISTQTIYTQLLKNDDNAISVPQLFFNGQLAYANIFFQGNMDMQAGVDMHWKSTYYAMGYDPVIQQFYTQINSDATKGFPSKAFPIVDVFFNMKVKKGRIFVKYNNLVQAFTKSGYFPTPYYPGQRPSIDFGFDILFYD